MKIASPRMFVPPLLALLTACGSLPGTAPVASRVTPLPAKQAESPVGHAQAVPEGVSQESVESPGAEAEAQHIPPEPGNEAGLDTSGTGAASPDLVKALLYAQFDEWKGVRYKIGGMSKKGVDCSAFTALTFQSRFGIELPRDTTQQAARGAPVERADLQPGDLVFFKTGTRRRHVGMYLEDARFLHASTRKGVMISSLNDDYWSKRYWKAVRVWQ